MILPLLHSPADIARWLFVAVGLGSDPTPFGNILTLTPAAVQALIAANPWPVFESSEPNVPETCLTVKNTTGHEFGRDQVTGEKWRHPGIQVRFRARDEVTIFQKAEAFLQAITLNPGQGGLIYQNPITIPDPAGGPAATYLVYNFNSVGDVNYLTKDQPSSRRSLATLNACIVVRRTA